MKAPGGRLILWTGPKHSGKTTAAASLARRARGEGFVVAGVLAPSVFAGAQLTGFDVVDLRTSRREPLARLEESGERTVGPFRFTAEGLALGAGSLSAAATRGADLVVVDEFGPLELGGGGWRAPVDALVREHAGVIVLVVREGLADRVRSLYASSAARTIRAADPGAPEFVIGLL
ncbi:MAG TPA: nucleoside-triphosphatase [Phycisphaerae bacterium]|nr:nucleoside-triphosphatase [Phycisphaerae bacterium]HUT58249.1 nucleoside-triphosphatase [Phycisphaerae bacterium]